MASGRSGCRLPERIDEKSRVANARVRDQRRDRRRIAVGELGPLALDEVEGLDGIGGRRAQQGRPGHEHTDDVVGETADPEHRRVREEPGPGVETADAVQRVEVAEQRAVLVDHALRRTGGPRRVDDDHAVVGGDVVLDRVEHRVGHVVGERLEGSRTRRATPAGGAAPPSSARRRRRGRRRRRARPRSRCRGSSPTPTHEVDVGAREQVAQLARRGERADGDGDGADAHRGQPREHEVDPGREEQTDPAAPTGAGREQPACEHPAAPFGVGVGQPVVVAHDVVGVGTCADVRTQHAADRGRSRSCPSRRHRGQRGVVALRREHVRLAEQVVAEEQLGVRGDAAVVDDALGAERRAA